MDTTFGTSDFNSLLTPTPLQYTFTPVDTQTANIPDASLSRFTGGLSDSLSELASWGLSTTTQAAQIADNIRAIAHGNANTAQTPPQVATEQASGRILGVSVSPATKTLIVLGALLIGTVVIVKILKR